MSTTVITYIALLAFFSSVYCIDFTACNAHRNGHILVRVCVNNAFSSDMGRLTDATALQKKSPRFIGGSSNQKSPPSQRTAREQNMRVVLEDSTNTAVSMEAHTSADLVKKPQMQATRNTPPTPPSNQHCSSAVAGKRRALTPLMDTVASRSVVIAPDPISDRSPVNSDVLSDDECPDTSADLVFSEHHSPIPSDLYQTLPSVAKESEIQSTVTSRQQHWPTVEAALGFEQRRTPASRSTTPHAFYSQVVYIHPPNGMYFSRALHALCSRTAVCMAC